MDTTTEQETELVSDAGTGQLQFETRRVGLPGGGALRLALGYRRSTDFDARDDPGQDYALLWAAGGRVVGVLADGVGQSFFGEIAARRAAEGITAFLRERGGAPPEPEELVGMLMALAADARRDVESRVIPEDVPTMARTALERTRAEAGSQAVFAAFAMDAARAAGRLYVVGDAGVVVHGAEPGAPGTPVLGDPSARWGTKGNAALRLMTVDFSAVGGLVLRSDGARDWGDVSGTAADEGAFRARAPQLAGFDDVSFVSVEIERPSAGPGPLLAEPRWADARGLPAAEARPTSAGAAPLRPRPVPSPPQRRAPTPEAALPAPASGPDPPGGGRASTGRRIPPLAVAALLVTVFAGGFAAGVGTALAWKRMDGAALPPWLSSPFRASAEAPARGERPAPPPRRAVSVSAPPAAAPVSEARAATGAPRTRLAPLPPALADTAATARARTDSAATRSAPVPSPAAGTRQPAGAAPDSTEPAGRPPGGPARGQH